MAAFERMIRMLPDATLLRAEGVYGRALKRVANHAPGRFLVRNSHRLVARAFGKVAGATRLTGELSPVEVAQQTMRKFFLPILDEPRQQAAGGWSFSLTTCPYGLTGSGDDRGMCHAIMNLEEEIMRQLGGELVIEERIAEGAPRCRFTVR